MKKGTNIIKYIVLSIASIISLFPFFWMLISTTNKAFDINSGKFKIGSEFLTNVHNMLIN